MRRHSIPGRLSQPSQTKARKQFVFLMSGILLGYLNDNPKDMSRVCRPGNCIRIRANNNLITESSESSDLARIRIRISRENREDAKAAKRTQRGYSDLPFAMVFALFASLRLQNPRSQ
jgi:hypothetical protein